jgi:glycerol-1-phosphate dehydrogenase [NAD(P)+]
MLNQTLTKYFDTPPALVEIASGLQNNIADIVTKLDFGSKFVIVSDENTHKFLGHKAEKALSAFNPQSIILPPGIADDKSVNKVASQIENSDLVIAIGSGTINDICKYASFQKNKPYIIFCTAPSMNGYSSANASITVGGHKKPLKAHLPKAILMDLDILAKSPVRLIKSGLGDSLCRPTAQADWLLSYRLLDTPYDAKPFEMLKPLEQDLFENSEALVNGDLSAIKLLAQTLILSGFGMYMCQGSYPASQGEHMIAHTMEMAFTNLPHAYHGEQIGITTIIMADIIERHLNGIPVVKQSIDEQQILRFFGENGGKQCLNEYREKLFTPAKLDAINHKISLQWSDIAEKISQILVKRDILLSTLKKASAPISAMDIGWDEDKFEQAVKFSKYSRNRFTFLDF